jgi:hypothetical protein
MHSQSAPAPAAAHPTITISARCETGRCAACKGVVISLAAPTGARCQHACHGAPVPATWKASIADAPPCELDAGDGGEG